MITTPTVSAALGQDSIWEEPVIAPGRCYVVGLVVSLDTSYRGNLMQRYRL
jgi:hypothetical protein